MELALTAVSRPVSNKIKFLRDQLKSKNPSLKLQDSQKLIISAYVYLYDEIQKYLVVEFSNSSEAINTLSELDKDAKKNELEKIRLELEMSKNIFKKNNWPVIDVTRKSVEEIAASVIKIYDIIHSR